MLIDRSVPRRLSRGGRSFLSTSRDPYLVESFDPRPRVISLRDREQLGWKLQAYEIKRRTRGVGLERGESVGGYPAVCPLRNAENEMPSRETDRTSCGIFESSMLKATVYIATDFELELSRVA